MKRFCPVLLLAVPLFPFFCGPLLAQVESLEVTSVSAATVDISFTAASGVSLGSFTLESNPGLLANDWVQETTASFAAIGGSSYTVTVPRVSGVSGANRFYRILLNGEVIVTFESNDFLEGSSGIPLSFDTPFTGPLPYTLLFSDGTSQEGSLNLSNATSASIPFSVFDDFQVSGERFVTLSVAPPSGSSFTQTFGISDDDVLWDGVFTDAQGAELTFCMEELNQNGALGLRLLNPNSSNFFPVGLGPVITSGTFDDSTLSATLTSASRLGDESAFGFPSYYELTLNGTVRAGSNQLFYEGGDLGDAILVHRVGRINPAATLAEDRFDLEASNDSLATATDLGALTTANPTLSLNGLSTAGNSDFFQFASTSGATVNVRIEFFHADGDIDMRTFSNSGALINTSAGITNTETFSFVSAGGTNTVEVYGFLDARNAYRLIVSTQDLPPATTGDHLSTTTNGRFAILQRPLQPSDAKAALLTPTN